MNEQNHPRLYRLLNHIERLGNKLPHPALLFFYLSLIVVAISWLTHILQLKAIHPISQLTLEPVNLLSSQGLRLFLTDMVKNFTQFAPLGSVLVAMLGFSLAEKSGWISALLKLVVTKSSPRILVPMILLAGILSHTGGDLGYVLLIPLSALAFQSAGLNPLAGLAISFAGVSGGFAANFLLSTADPMLAGITQEAARLLDPEVTVSPLSNWYFMSASSILIIVVGTYVAQKITIPFLGPLKVSSQTNEPQTSLSPLSPIEKKGLIYSGIALLFFILFLILGHTPSIGFLLDPKSSDLLNSFALKGVVPLIFILGSLLGLVYGKVVGIFKKSSDIISAMQDSMVTMAPYIVMVFFASQFIALFNQSNIGLILAVNGSIFLKSLNLNVAVLIGGFLLLTVFLDLIIGSASAKWTLMAPIFVPMFILLGIQPELTQAAYRVADSVVNIISPLMTYFPMILAFANKYDPNAKVGTLIALMLPYSISFLIFWSLMLMTWIYLGWPLGL